jgi:hypothetical protein
MKRNANIKVDNGTQGQFLDINDAIVAIPNGSRIMILADALGLSEGPPLTIDLEFSSNDLEFYVDPTAPIDITARSIILSGNNHRGNLALTDSGVAQPLELTGTGHFLEVNTPQLSPIKGNAQGVLLNGKIQDKSGFKDPDCNGSFRFWQRGTSTTIKATPTYLCDRFEAWGAGAGANFSAITDSNGDPIGFQFTGTTDDVYLSRNTESLNAKKLNIPTGGTVPYTVAIDASTTAATAPMLCTVEVVYPSVKDNYTTVSATPLSKTMQIQATTTRTSVTFDLPDTLGGYDYFNGFQVKMTFSYDTSGGTISIQKWQGELGAYATDFELVPYEVELARCQRYTWKSFPQGFTPVNGGTAVTLGVNDGVISTADIYQGSTFPFYYRFPSPMRGAVTVTTYGNSAGQAYLDKVTGGAWSSAFTVVGNSEGLRVAHNAGAVDHRLHFHALADSEIY